MKLPKKKKFAVVYADPPWLQKTWSAAGLEGRPQHYERMKLSDIKAIPVGDVAAKDAWLFLWTTGPHMEQAFEVIKSWGFKYSGMGFVWIKLNKNSPILFFNSKDVFMGGDIRLERTLNFAFWRGAGSRSGWRRTFTK